MLVRTTFEKEQDMAGEMNHMKVEQHFPWTNTLVLTPGDKHNKQVPERGQEVGMDC